MADYQAVVGLEVHLHLKTKSKMFCSCSADYFGAEPNTHTCPVCLGLPGVLPKVNAQAVDYGILFGMALDCTIAPWTQFHRKSYFYPDMPKNYQTSQYDLPIAEGGKLVLDDQTIRINRVHLEEDAGKSSHPSNASHSLIDLNRAGSPLIEMVTEPDIRSPEQARVFLTHVQAIAKAMGVSEADPEKGKMRADVNVSVHLPGTPYGTKVEVKNLNSFRSVARALEYEIKRQTELAKSGKPIQQATMGWDDAAGKTYVMRVKEGEADYRYFPDPDLPPIVVDQAWKERIKATMPELPAAKHARYVGLGVRTYDADILAYNASLSGFFDRALEAATCNPQTIANLINADIAGYLNDKQISIEDTKLQPAHLAQLALLFEKRDITNRVVAQILPEVLDGQEPNAIIEARGLKAVSDVGTLKPMVQAIVDANPKAAEELKAGNLKAVNALLGQAMRESKGTAKPDLIKQLIGEILGINIS